MLPVLCYGDICADLLIPYGQALASRQKDVDPDALTVRFSHGGSVANTAVTLARLGTPALFLGTTGQDAFGRALKAGLTQEGVDASLLTLKASAMTTMVLLVLDEQGERVPFAYPRVRASQHDVSADQIPDDILSRISWMHSSGMTLREDPAAANQLSLMRRCHEAGIPVALDVNARLESLQDRTFAENMQAALCCCDLLFGSAEDELCPLADETDNKVYAVFTLSNGQPVSAAFGTDTDSWFLSKAGGLYLRREAGEMNADYVIYSFGGTKLEAFFGCFAGDGTDGSAPGYYRVAYGDRHSGTAFDVTREEFESDIESFEATIIPLSSLTGI